MPSDHTLKFDGAASNTTANLIWEETASGLQTGVSYQFFFWVRPRTGGHTIRIEAIIDGVSLGTFANSGGGWQQFSATYTHSNTATTAAVELRQKAFGAFTDCDIDDITLMAWPIHIQTRQNADMRSMYGQGKTLYTTTDYEYAAGMYLDEIDIYGTSLTSNSTTWLPWLAKFTKDKNLLWTADIKGTNFTSTHVREQGGVTGIDVDQYGNTYLAGYFDHGTLTFDGTTTFVNYGSGQWTSYLAKYDDQGSLLWVRHIESTTPGSPSASTKNLGGVKVSSDGTKVYMVGSMENFGALGYTVNFPPNSFTSTTGATLGYLAEFDAATGDNLRLTTSSTAHYGVDFEMNSTDVYIGGFTGSHSAQPFISRIELSSFAWGVTNIGSVPSPQINYVVGWSVALSKNHVYLGGFGYGRDPVCFNTECTSPGYDYRGWVAQFNLGLVCTNLGEITSTTATEPITVHDVLVDDKDMVYVTGETNAESTNYYDNTGNQRAMTLPVPGSVQDLYVVKYEPNFSDVIWAREYGGDETDCASGALAFNDAMGGVYFSGFYKSGAMNVGPGPLPIPAGSSDYFMARLDLSNGTGFKKGATGISELSPASMNVFPNPGRGTLFVELGEELQGTYSFTIHNLLGQELLRKNGLEHGVQSVDVAGLAQGTYVFRIVDANGILVDTNKVIIQ